MNVIFYPNNSVRFNDGYQILRIVFKYLFASFPILFIAIFTIHRFLLRLLKQSLDILLSKLYWFTFTNLFGIGIAFTVILEDCIVFWLYFMVVLSCCSKCVLIELLILICCYNFLIFVFLLDSFNLIFRKADLHRNRSEKSCKINSIYISYMNVKVNLLFSLYGRFRFKLAVVY